MKRYTSILGIACLGACVLGCANDPLASGLGNNPSVSVSLLFENDRGDTEALEMPDRYVREMVAGWAGAGRAITGEWEPGTWYLKNRDKMDLHPKTRCRAENLLHAIEPWYDQKYLASLRTPDS